MAWIDTSHQVKDYRAISKEQLDTILTKTTSNTTENLVRNRAILAFLFDSGCRAQELLNIRLTNLSKDKGNYKVRIEHSKTKRRTIAVPLAKEYLEEWLKMHPLKGEPLAQLFPLSYTALVKVVKNGGKRIGWRLTPHSLRHSSVTYYAGNLSRYQLCYRYGWSMSSRQPDRYIDQEGLEQEKIIETVEADKVSKLSQENRELNQRLAMLEEQMERMMKADKEELRRVLEKMLR